MSAPRRSAPPSGKDLPLITLGLRSVLKEISGFPQRLGNLENVSGHGKVMETEKLAKSHGIL